MRKVVYIISDVTDSVGFEWVLSALQEKELAVSVILINAKDSNLAAAIARYKIPCYHVRCRSKPAYLPACLKILQVLRRVRPHVVHCHLLTANIVGLTAARILSIKSRIYTRHHSSEHHDYHPKGVKLDRYCNRIATKIIAISPVVFKILQEWESVPVSKLVLIPHGFNLNDFIAVDPSRVQNFKNTYDLASRSPIVGCISRFTYWKGVQYAIPAFKMLLEKFPDAVLVLLNARGNYEAEIHDLLSSIPARNFRAIAFERDIAAAYHAFDMFVHVPVDEHSEAFGQIYVESLAAGVPSIFTLSGIATEFANTSNAYIVPFKDSYAIYESMVSILGDYSRAKNCAAEGARIVKKHYSLERMVNKLQELYNF